MFGVQQNYQKLERIDERKEVFFESVENIIPNLMNVLRLTRLISIAGPGYGRIRKGILDSLPVSYYNP